MEKNIKMSTLCDVVPSKAHNSVYFDQACSSSKKDRLGDLGDHFFRAKPSNEIQNLCEKYKVDLNKHRESVRKFAI